MTRTSLPRPCTVNVHDFVEVEYASPSPDVKQDEDGQVFDDLAFARQDGAEVVQNTGDNGTDDNTALLAYITKQTPLPSGTDIRSILASAHIRPKSGVNAPINTKGAPFANNASTTVSKEIMLNGKRYIQTDTHRVDYCIAEAAFKESTKISSLMDRGANGGLAGQDVRLIETTMRMANVSGINNHTLQGLPIATVVAGVVLSHLGPICLIMHQYAYHGKGKTIHSSVQVEHYGNEVNDRSSKI